MTVFLIIKMPKVQFDVNVANVVAIDVAYDVLSIKWMERYSKRFIHQSHSYMQQLNDLMI